MQAAIHILTLSVADLPAAVTFYRDGLGLPTDGIVGTEFEDGAVAFFRLAGGLTLALYPRAALAKDAKVPLDAPAASELSIGHLVADPRAVDALMARAAAAGARITDPARQRFWGGYSGYFQDPDGHLWEVAWNPSWPG